MKFKQGSFYLLEDGTIGTAHFSGLFFVVDMTAYRTREQFETLGIQCPENVSFIYKGTEYFTNNDFYPTGEGVVVKKLKKKHLQFV